MPDEDDFVLLQLLQQQFRKIYAILNHPVDGDGGGDRRSVSSEGSSGAPLVPLDDGEILQPVAKTCVPPGIGRIAGPSMQEQQHRVLAVFAANRDPLLEAADLNIVRFVDSVWSGDRIVPRVASA